MSAAGTLVPYGILADAVVVLHLAFVLFVGVGGFLVTRHPRLALLHLPAVAWAVAIELTGARCPLTPLENRLREAAGAAGYAGDFIARHLVPVLYPAGLTRRAQIALGLAALVVNAVVYHRLVRARVRRRGRDAASIPSR